VKLKSVLHTLVHQRTAAQLANDPLSFCHRFAAPADQEVVALVAAAYSYGSAKAIRGFLERIFAIMGESPRRFVETFCPTKGREQFHGCRYRFNDATDLCALLLAIRTMLVEAGSIEAYFLQFHDPVAADVGPALSDFCRAVLAMDYREVFGPAGIPPASYFRFFFPSPASGSACKRLCMFLRWVVRPADGFDLGLWHGVRPAQLIIPVDAHVQRICRLLGLTTRRQADWRMACEITAALRQYDAGDPVQYDFAIAHVGISAGCTGLASAVCEDCGLAACCQREVPRRKHDSHS
jgi:uncharacterized protein (TIGR02757 family)